MPLMSLGSVVFEVMPLNIDAHDQSTAADYAEKPVAGIRPPLEFVGEGGETRSLSGKLFPETLGGNLNDLQTMRQSGQAVPLTMGNGVAAGWFVIDKISAKHTALLPSGEGRMIAFDISLKRSDGPAAADLYSLLVGLFG